MLLSLDPKILMTMHAPALLSLLYVTKCIALSLRDMIRYSPCGCVILDYVQIGSRNQKVETLGVASQRHVAMFRFCKALWLVMDTITQSRSGKRIPGSFCRCTHTVEKPDESLGVFGT